MTKKDLYAPSPPQSTRSGGGPNDDDKSDPSQRIRKRDKYFLDLFHPSSSGKKARHARTASAQSNVEIEHAVSSTKAKSPDMRAESSTLPTKPCLNIFPTNVAKPILLIELPKKQDRIEKTPQLVYCASLLPRDGLALWSVGEPQDQDEILDETQRAWLKEMEQDPIEQDHIRWLGTRMVEEFIKDPSKDSVEISEIVLLGPVLQKEYYRKLLSCIIKEFDESRILDVDLLQGLIQLVQSASPGFLVPDDLVKILSILRARLQGTHQQSSEHPYHLTLGVSRLLDVMAEHEVEDLDRVLEYEPLSAVLGGLSGSSDPYLMYQACYAFQALQYVPDNETALQAVLRHSTGVVDGLVKISDVLKLGLESALDGLKNLQEAVSSTYEIVGSAYEGFCSLRESGRGVWDSLKEGLGTGQKRPWYPALCAAYAFVQEGQLADLNRFICEASCRLDPLFQWGVCQLLGEIAVDPIWTATTRQQAIDLLGTLFKDDAEWGQDESVKDWMLTIIGHLASNSEQTVSEKAHSLLQDIKKEQDSMAQLSYPLRARLPLPSSSPILARVQGIPYVEYDLHKLRLQQLEQGRQAVYIPPQAKPTLQAKDEDLFPLMEKVQKFLSSERQVMLILGDSGAGKSTFNRHLEHELWTGYKQGGPIPLFINLPAIHGPERDMVTKQLQAHNFSDAQIKELKQHRQLVLICDGYDESQLLVNLHKTNSLNQPGQWNTKMIISCRTQFLGPTYIDRFQPLRNDRYTSSAAELFQQVVIAPFNKDQIDEYIDQFRNTSSTRLLFGDQPVWSTKDYMDKLMAIPNLMDLVKNPFLLSLALKTLPNVVDTKQNLSNIRITRVGLYDKFVTQWLEINMQRLQTSTLTHEEQRAFQMLVDDGFVQSGIDLMMRLSAALFKEQNGNPAVQYSHSKEKRTWKAEFFSPDPEVKLLREASPLTRTGNLYRFVHRSVMEYFYSCTVYSPNGNDANDGEFSPQPPSSSASLFGSISEHPLSQRNLVAEPSIIQFLAERVQSIPVFKQQLLDIIELSKTDVQASQAAGNAITILVKAKVWFNGADLRGIRIPGADLSGGQFDSAHLQGSDLTGADLTRGWIRQANFSNTHMDGLQFGELPYVKADSSVYTCAYSPDGKTLAAGLLNSSIYIYDTTTWMVIRCLHNNNSGSIRSIAFSPCGKRLVSGSLYGTAQLWDCETGSEALLLEDNRHHSLKAAVYSPSGKHVATAVYGDPVRLRDPDTGALLFAMRGHTKEVTGLAFSPDGLWLASSSKDGSIRLYDTQSGSPGLVLKNANGGVSSIAFSPDGKQIVAGHGGGQVQLWDVVTGGPGLVLSGHSGSVNSVSFSPSGQWVASASSDGTARLWDVQSGGLVSVFAGHSATLYCVAFAPDGSHLTTGSLDETIRFWKLNAIVSNPVSQDHSAPVVSVDCSYDGRWIISGRKDGTVQQFDAATGKPGYVYPSRSRDASRVAFSPTSPLFASVSQSSDEYGVTVWNADTGTLRLVLPGHTKGIYSVVFSPCGNWIASGSYDNTIRLWNAHSGTPDRILEGHKQFIHSLAFSRDGHRLVSSSTDRTVRVWEMATGESRIVYDIAGSLDFVDDVTYAPCGQRIAACIRGKVVFIGDQTGKALQSLDSGQSACYSGQSARYSGQSARYGGRSAHYSGRSARYLWYSSCGEWIATGGYQNACIWKSTSSVGDSQEWAQPITIEGFFGGLVRVAWKPNALELVTGCEDGSVRAWRILTESDGYSAQLVWSDGYSVLEASKANIAGAVGLSDTNRRLLEQRGAIVKSTSEEDNESQ